MKRRFLVIVIIIAIIAVAGCTFSNEILSSAASMKINNELKGEKIKNVTYKTIEGKSIKLDIYMPTVNKYKKTPVIVYVHAGGWEWGDKEQEIALFTQAIDSLRQNGYAFVSINYRLTTGNVKFPSHIEDVKDSVRWLKKHSTTYNFDSDSIGIMGASAGGHLSLLAGLSGDKDFEGASELKEYSSKVKYIISFFGPTDLRGTGAKEIEKFLGAAEDEDPEIYKKASPVTWLKKGAPPILLIHGENDEVVPVSQSQNLYDKGKKLGMDMELIRVKNAKHGLMPSFSNDIDPDMNTIAEKIWSFAKR